jgi:ATP citrate (pro-S)-lyase
LTASSSNPDLPKLGQVVSPVQPTKKETAASRPLFTPETRSIIYGMQPTACQNMLDFDFLCGRKTPSVAALVYTFSANHYMKFYWNTSEILVPVFSSLEEALKKFPEVDVAVNFASFRSVFDSTTELLAAPQLRTIAIIAEGVPERRTRLLIRTARERGVTIIGPATVGGIKPGCFRIGNTGGMLDNVISSKLYRPGSVAYVARSGGMSNEVGSECFGDVRLCSLHSAHANLTIKMQLRFYS